MKRQELIDFLKGYNKQRSGPADYVDQYLADHQQVERSCKNCGITEGTYWHPRCNGCGEEYKNWKPQNQ